MHGSLSQVSIAVDQFLDKSEGTASVTALKCIHRHTKPSLEMLVNLVYFKDEPSL